MSTFAASEYSKVLNKQTIQNEGCDLKHKTKGNISEWKYPDMYKPIKHRNKFLCVTGDNLNQVGCIKDGVAEIWIDRD